MADLSASKADASVCKANASKADASKANTEHKKHKTNASNSKLIHCKYDFKIIIFTPFRCRFWPGALPSKKLL